MKTIPPLPQAIGWLGLFAPGGEKQEVYTAEQMHTYAAAVRREALEDAAQAVENYDTAQCDTGWGPSQYELAETIRSLQSPPEGTA